MKSMVKRKLTKRFLLAHARDDGYELFVWPDMPIGIREARKEFKLSCVRAATIVELVPVKRKTDGRTN